MDVELQCNEIVHISSCLCTLVVTVYLSTEQTINALRFIAASLDYSVPYLPESLVK